MDAPVGGAGRWSWPIPIELALVALPILFASRLSGRCTFEVLFIVTDRFRPRSPFFRAYPRGFSHIMFFHDLSPFCVGVALRHPENYHVISRVPKGKNKFTVTCQCTFGHNTSNVLVLESVSKLTDILLFILKLGNRKKLEEKMWEMTPGCVSAAGGRSLLDVRRLTSRCCLRPGRGACWQGQLSRRAVRPCRAPPCPYPPMLPFREQARKREAPRLAAADCARGSFG